MAIDRHRCSGAHAEFHDAARPFIVLDNSFHQFQSIENHVSVCAISEMNQSLIEAHHLFVAVWLSESSKRGMSMGTLSMLRKIGSESSTP